VSAAVTRSEVVLVGGGAGGAELAAAPTRTIIDGHKVGFCKLIADRKTSRILGCHVVGERAVDIVQVAAIAVAAGMRVHDLASIPLSFPSYAGILFNAAASAALQLGLTVAWQAHQVEGTRH
jgi:hypothetical protein